MKRPNGPCRDDRFRSNNRERGIRYYYAMQSELFMRERVACSSSQLHTPQCYTSVTEHLFGKAPIIIEEGAEMALFNIRGQLAIISHGDCNHPLVIRRIASGPRLSIWNPAIFYPIKKRLELLSSCKMQLSNPPWNPFATSVTTTTTGDGNSPIVLKLRSPFCIRNATSHGQDRGISPNDFVVIFNVFL